MPIMNPEYKFIAQRTKLRHANICRKCNKKFRGCLKCPRCGSKQFREIDHSVKPQK